jgi:hypothetical protein
MYLPLDVEIARVDTTLSKSHNTAITVITLTTGFEMVGSSQFALCITDPTPDDYARLRSASVIDAMRNICNIDEQSEAVRELFYDLLAA